MSSLSESEQKTDKDLSGSSYIVDGVLIDIYGIPHMCSSRIDNENLNTVRRIMSLDTPVYFDSEIGARYNKSKNIAYDWLSVSPLDAVKHGFISVAHPTLIFSKLKESFQCLFKMKVNEENLSKSLANVNSEECVRKLIALHPEQSSSYEGIPTWLRVMSKYVNYPLVSIYLIEYLVYHARMNGFRHVSLICTESIVGLVQWYAQNYDDLEHWVRSHSDESKSAVHNTIENKYYYRYRKHVYKNFSRLGKLIGSLLYLLPSIYVLV